MFPFGIFIINKKYYEKLFKHNGRRKKQHFRNAY